MKMVLTTTNLAVVAAVIVVAMTATASARAQASPTALEAFTLRIKCKELADQKAESMWRDNPNLSLQPYVVLRYYKSKYDAEFNQCYLELYDHTVTEGDKPIDKSSRVMYDGQIDDILAFSRTVNGIQSGMIFEPKRQRTFSPTLGKQSFDEANTYIDEMMTETRR